MRALCGAIITAGAMIGLGLWSIGVGQRYAIYPYRNPDTSEVQWVYLKDLDTSLMVSLIALLAVTAIGLGVAFLGLMYHHHRRHLELLHRYRQHAQPTPPAGTAATPPDRPPSERVTL